MRNRRNVSQTAVLWVVATACVIAIGGTAGMFWMADHGRQIPDQLDRITFAALTGALVLLSRTSDTKAEAEDAAQVAAGQLVRDLKGMAPTPVVGVPGGTPIVTTDAQEPAAPDAPPAPAPG